MKKVRWGVIGCGGIAEKRTIPGMLLADNAECIAIMDINKEKVEEVKKEFNIERGFATVEDLLSQSDIDAVYIATPVFCHKQQVFAAADAGKHILLEKPMGLTSLEAEEIKRYCEDKGVLLGVGFMMRFHDAHERIKAVISDGAIGEVVSAYAKFNCLSTPEEETLWRQERARGGGGAMMDMGIHCIDLLQYLTSLKAETVTAFSGNQIFSYIDVEDASTAIMRMENGAFFTVEANFNIPDETGGCKFEIYGTKGSVESVGTLGQTEEGRVYITTLEKGRKLLPYVSGNMYTKEISKFSDAILNNIPIPVTACEGIFNQKIVEAVYESGEAQRHIKL